MTEPASPANQGTALDPEFFTCVNEFVEVANRQMKKHGSKRVSAAILHAAARCNVHMFMGATQSSKDETEAFFRYMTDLYTRMLADNFVLHAQEHGLPDPRQANAEPTAE
jgi:hypothetical protein